MAINSPLGPRTVEEKPAEEAKGTKSCFIYFSCQPLLTLCAFLEEEEEAEEGAEDVIPKPKQLTGEMKELDESFNESIRVLTEHFK